MADGRSFESELRGRLWSNHFGWQSLFDVGHAPAWKHWTKSRPADQSLTGHPMSFDRLKRTQRRKRLPGHKLKPSRATLFVQNSKPHLSMKPTYFLGIDAAKHKMRATLSNRSEHVLFEKDLSVQEARSPARHGTSPSDWRTREPRPLPRFTLGRRRGRREGAE